MSDYSAEIHRNSENIHDSWCYNQLWYSFLEDLGSLDIFEQVFILFCVQFYNYVILTLLIASSRALYLDPNTRSTYQNTPQLLYISSLDSTNYDS